MADGREFEREEAAARAKARGRVSKAEDRIEYYDVVEDLKTTDKDRMPRRTVLGDISVLSPKLEFMKPTTRVYETAGDMAVPRDSFLSPNLGESQPPTQRYICDNPEHKRPADAENWLAAGESEGVRPANFVAPKPAVLKRAAGLFSNLIQRGHGEN